MFSSTRGHICQAKGEHSLPFLVVSIRGKALRIQCYSSFQFEASSMNIVEICDQVAAKMRSDLAEARSALKHPGLKGTSFEEVFRRFLRNYLPAILDISTGVIVASGETVSPDRCKHL